VEEKKMTDYKKYFDKQLKSIALEAKGRKLTFEEFFTSLKKTVYFIGKQNNRIEILSTNYDEVNEKLAIRNAKFIDGSLDDKKDGRRRIKKTTLPSFEMDLDA
jgi:hypothetical protein